MAKFFKPKSRSSNNKPRKHKSTAKQLADFNAKILDYDHNAKGIAKHDSGRIVFSHGAIIGETVRLRPTSYTDKVIQAQVIDVVTPSELRIEPKCEYFGQCGGCQLQYMSNEQQLSAKQHALDGLLKKQLGLNEIPWQSAIDSAPWQYRRTARLALWYENKQLTIGFRASQSKHIIDINQCPILAPELTQLVQELKPVLSSLSQPKAFTHLQIFGVDSGNHAILRCMKPLSEEDQTTLAEFAARHNIHLLLEHSKQSYKTLTSLPEQAKNLQVAESAHVHSATMEYKIDNFAVRFQPEDFIQINDGVNQAMVQQALNWLNVQPDDTLLDLFAGLGNFTLPLAKLAKKVFAVEGVNAMVKRLKQNAELNNIDNIQAFQADLSKIELKTKPKWLTKVDKMLLDPARDGAFDVVKKIPLFAPKQILYVSCNPATMTRDLQQLLNSGYSLTKMGLLNMFPQTSHVEAMALLELK